MSDESKTRGKRWEDAIPEEARKHFRAARDEWQRSFEGLFPPGFVEHRRAARREMLLGLRGLIDAAIERTEKTSSSREG